MMIRPRTRRTRMAGLPAYVLGGLLAVLAGCMSVGQQARFQAADEPEKDRYEVETVGTKTSAVNAEPIPVGGVGLVEDLDGTGGEPPPDENRARLEDNLRKRGEREVKKLLNSTESALVLVSGVIPPGTRKGDPIDIEVRVPRGNPATSLRGGVLRECVLRNYTTMQQLTPGRNGNGLVDGHPLVVAEGPVLVGLGDKDDDSRLKTGRIWGGGRSKIDLPYNLVLNGDQQLASMAKLVSDRVNMTFLGQTRTTPNSTIATPRVDAASATIALAAPAQYRQNYPRFLRVVRLIPLREPGAGGLEGSPTAAVPYRHKLQEDLRDPARCVVAALRLEALGAPAVPLLKDVLRQSDNLLVRFCAAEALSYLGSPAGAEELAAAAKRSPTLRAFALTALASLDEAACQEALQDLVAEATDDEARYGAFRALRLMNERAPLVRGEHLNDSFWLHTVKGGSRPMVHLTTVKRAEVALFDEPCLVPPFSLPCGHFVLSAGADDATCIVSLVEAGADPVRKQCSLKVADVLRTMAALGATYPDAMDLLRQGQQLKLLSGPVRVDALPRAVPVEELAQMGRAGGLGE